MSLRDMLFWFFLTLFGTGTYVIYGSQTAEGEVLGIAMIVVGFAGMVGCAWPHLRDPLTGKVQLTWVLAQRIIHDRLYRKAAMRVALAYIVISVVVIGGHRVYRHYYPLIQSTVSDTSGPLLPIAPLQSLTVSQIKLVFKEQPIGKTSGHQAVTVINRANAPRIITGIDISGNFAQTNDCPQELMVGDSCTFDVTFTPVAVGLTHGSLEISCIDPLFSTVKLWATVDFSGSGKTSPAQPVRPSLPKPSADIRISSQKPIASADPSMPYGLEVVVTTDKDISPVAFNFIFSGEVAKVQAIPVQGPYTEEQGGIIVTTPNVVFYQRQSPAFVAAVPMVLYVYSKSYIEMKRIESVPFNFPHSANELRD